MKNTALRKTGAATYLVALTISLLMLWAASYTVQTQWNNVPNPGGEAQLRAQYLGDEHLAYRASGLILQNIGDTGGRAYSFDDYNYDHLKLWFDVMTRLDSHSSFVPILAGYYFSSVKDPQKLRVVIEYLEHVGANEQGENWRWLAQAIFLTRYDLEDLDYALELSHILAALKNPDMPGWSRQMPVLIMAQMGRKDAALAFMLDIIHEQSDDMHPNEVNFMIYYICDRLLENDIERARYSFCSGDY